MNRQVKEGTSLYQLGTAAVGMAGLENVESLTSSFLGYGGWGFPGVRERPDTGVAGIFDSPSVAIDYVKSIDASVEALTRDLSTNIKRVEFMQSFATWHQSWKEFFAGHSTSAGVIMSGRDATMAQAKAYQDQLGGWREAYTRETGGKPPTGPLPDAPKGVVSSSSSWFSLPTVSTSTKVVLGAVVLGAIGIAVYAAYSFARQAKARSDLGKEVVGPYLAHASRGALTEGQTHRMLAGGGE